MLVSEFIDRTGYQPTPDEYADIEQAYYAFAGDKDSFCRAWSKATAVWQNWKYESKDLLFQIEQMV